MALLLEELGHAVDARLHVGDAPGDEGEIFARLALGQTLTAATLAQLQQENDHSVLTINGAPVAVELATQYGAVTLDGNLADWTPAHRLDAGASGVAGYELYGRFEGGAYVFAIKANAPIGANTTLWLNTDQNRATGYQIWGFAGGAEYNINFAADGTPSPFTGAAGQTPSSGPLDFSYRADRTIVELAVPLTLLASAPNAINIYADVNDQVFLPTTPVTPTQSPV